jgi:hypothetical protein
MPAWTATPAAITTWENTAVAITVAAVPAMTMPAGVTRRGVVGNRSDKPHDLHDGRATELQIDAP